MKKRKKTISAIIIAVLMVTIFNHFFVTYRAIGASMMPTHSGNTIGIGLKEEFVEGDFSRGDLIVFNMGEEQLLKRVIGIPGDVVMVHIDKVYVNYEVLDEPYILEPMMDIPYLPVRLKEDEYYVMGDNRNKSMDSRHFGPISRTDIEYKAGIAEINLGSRK